MDKIVAGGCFAALSFVLALDQLWNPSLDRPEVIIYEKYEREKCFEKTLTWDLGEQICRHTSMKAAAMMS